MCIGKRIIKYLGKWILVNLELLFGTVYRSVGGDPSDVLRRSFNWRVGVILGM